jgi:peptidoglycan/xylan/chitin deacetylase (PgdA/CDA1 family)
VVRNPTFIVRRLASGARAGAILLLHDGALGDRPPPAMGEILPRLFEALDERGLRSVCLPDGLIPADTV